MHELVRHGHGWEFRPRYSRWRNAVVCLLGFTIPFMTIFAGILSLVFHENFRLGGWPVSILRGALATVASAGTAVAIMGMSLRASYGRLCRLNIPADTGHIEFDSPEETDPETMGFAACLKWAFQPPAKLRHRTIPRELVTAVQLCPWKLVMGSHEKTITWAVQGLLVLSSATDANYDRLPILLTNDCVGAAQLMRALASALDVPYLFGGDAAGWKAEELRAKTRPPLQMGSIGGM